MRGVGEEARAAPSRRGGGRPAGPSRSRPAQRQRGVRQPGRRHGRLPDPVEGAARPPAGPALDGRATGVAGAGEPAGRGGRRAAAQLGGGRHLAAQPRDRAVVLGDAAPRGSRRRRRPGPSGSRAPGARTRRPLGERERACPRRRVGIRRSSPSPAKRSGTRAAEQPGDGHDDRDAEQGEADRPGHGALPGRAGDRAGPSSTVDDAARRARRRAGRPTGRVRRRRPGSQSSSVQLTSEPPGATGSASTRDLGPAAQEPAGLDQAQPATRAPGR